MRAAANQIGSLQDHRQLGANHDASHVVMRLQKATSPDRYVIMRSEMIIRSSTEYYSTSLGSRQSLRSEGRVGSKHDWPARYSSRCSFSAVSLARQLLVVLAGGSLVGIQDEEVRTISVLTLERQALVREWCISFQSGCSREHGHQ